MHILDIVIGIPILYFVYKGAVNGLVKEVLNIVGIILAIILTFAYMDAFGELIAPFFEENSAYIPFVSGAVIFLGTLIIIAIIAVLTKKFLETVNLGAVNRSFGALFGALKAALLISTALILLSGFNVPAEESRDESYLYPYIIYAGPWTYEAVTFLYPGAEGYKATIENTLSKYNPVENLPILNKKN